ncbi:MAG: ceramidase domain-containing protein [Hyphomicrobiaceae bacterium]
MDWTAQVFNYCERGLDPAFWAEPLNALSNAAFLLAAGLTAQRLQALPEAAPNDWRERGNRLVLWTLVLLVIAIGTGSFLFHTLATRWALIADVGPITGFMVVYLAYALRTLVGLGWLTTLAILPAFVAAGAIGGEVTCSGGADASGAAEPCLNGSLGYLPALLSLWIIGLVLVSRGNAQGRHLLGAGAVFLVSILLRTLDRDACAATRLLGHARGTHVFWHLLNGLTLYLLLDAAVRRHIEDLNRDRAPDRKST